MFYKKIRQIRNIEKIENLCQNVFKNFPETTIGNASGKFSKHYEVWQFYKDSQVPLIQEVVNLVEQSKKDFCKAFSNKIFSYQYVQIVRNKDCRNLLCIPHKDGYWFDGQFHLTVLGNANISIWSGGRESAKNKQSLWFENGSFWYINSSEYYHTINQYFQPTKNNKYERIEILIPLNGEGNQKDEQKIVGCVSNDKDRFFYPDNPRFIELKKTQIQYVLNSYKNNKASSPYPIGFIHNIKNLNPNKKVVPC